MAALLTAFYSWRLMFLAFHGTPRASKKVMGAAHESPPVMLIPLALLALGSLGAGFLFENLFIGEAAGGFWRGALSLAPGNDMLEAMHHTPLSVAAVPTVMMVLGFAIAWAFYIAAPDTPSLMARTLEPIYLFLMNKWYFDELYDLLFVRTAKRLGRFLWKVGDGTVIDGIGPDGVAARVIDVTNRVVRIQTGYVYHYAFAMLIGVALLITYFMFTGGVLR